MVTYCANRAQADAEQAEWLKTAIGQSLPNQWGNQCSAAMQSYSVALFGRPWAETLGYGNAIDHIDIASSTYFEKVWNNPKDPNLLPRAGDIAVYRGAAPLWDGRYYGHTGAVDSFNAARQTLAQQDGAAPPTRRFPDGYNYSVKPMHHGTFLYIGDPAVGDVRGWLRPRWQKVVYTGADRRGYGTTTTVAPRPSGPAQAPATPTKTYAERFDPSPNHSGRRPQGVKLGGVVIHWWDDPAKRPSLNGVVSWFKNRASQVSAHYVVEAGTAVQMVTDDHVAWHAGSKYWNDRTIGIECNPRMSAGDLETVAQLVAALERKHGSLKVYKHSDVNPGTACPGTYAGKIDWLVNRVNAINSARGSSQATTTSVSTDAWSIEELLTMSQAQFDRDRRKAGTAAWYLANGRDHAANASRDARAAAKDANLAAYRGATTHGLLRGLPASIFGTKVQRPDKSEVTLAAALAYEKDNWVTDRAAQDEILAEQKKTNELLGRLVTALEGK